MANTIVQLHSLPALGALTLKLYPRTGGAIVNGASGDDLTEDGTTPGLYLATVAEALVGIYAARVYSGAELLGSFLVDLLDDTGAYDLADPAIAVGMGAQALAEVGDEFVAGSGQVTGFTNAALLQLAGLQIQVRSPANGDDADLIIVRGDDYLDADGRAQTWTLTGDVPDLTDATAKLTLKLKSTTVEFDSLPPVQAGSDWVIKVEMATADTSVLALSTYWKYDLQVTLQSGSKWTPRYNRPAKVVEDFTA